MTTAALSAAPPSPDVLLEVLTSHQFATSLPAVAMFLASPVGVNPGANAGSDGDEMWLRDRTVVLDPAADLHTIAHTAADLAETGHRAGDLYLDLSAGPETWFKVMPSGSRLVAFGPHALWGTPKIALGTGVALDAVSQLVAACRAGEVAFPVLLGCDEPVVVEGNAKRVTMTALLAEPQMPVELPGTDAAPHVLARAAGEDLARLTGGTLVSVAPTDGPGRWTAGLKICGTYVMVEFEVSAGAYRASRWPGPVGAGDRAEFFTVAGQLVHTATGLICRRP